VTRIDIGTVLRNSANLPYTNLVTRSTGAAVRRCIELELEALPADETATLDFSRIGVMDFSCADEIVAKLLLDPPLGATRPARGMVIFHGITDHHLEAIEDVLHHHGLAMVVHFADGGARLVGTVSDDERMTWELVYAAGATSVQALAVRSGKALDELHRTLESLHARRLVRQSEDGYAPLGTLQ
jgi:hypothetical protein